MPNYRVDVRTSAVLSSEELEDLKAGVEAAAWEVIEAGHNYVEVTIKYD